MTSARSPRARLRALLPGARTTVLPGCGHFAHVERPRETVRALGSGR